VLHNGGVIRSSEEDSVIEMEQRDNIVSFGIIIQLQRRI